jgi:arylformamidase
VRFYQDLRYGSSEREYLDIFPAVQPNAPVQVFFHGGYWQAMEKAVFHFLANGFIDKGITVVCVNYPLAPQASMDEIVRACRHATVWLYQHISDYHGDPSRIYISGHSAGGHLVAMLMATQWKTFGEQIPQDLIKGGCAISGLFSLIPVQLCYLNTVLGMDEATAQRNSPLFLSPTCSAPLIISVGKLESDEYHAQSRDVAIKWEQQGVPVTEITVANANHFSILDHVVDRKMSLNQAILSQMEIS